MKRLSLIMILLLPVSLAQYPDVPAGHWAEEAVLNMTEMGIVTGFPDGLFRGGNGVTRYEMALIITRVWNNWSVEELDDVWQELIVQKTNLSALNAEQELINLALSELSDQLERTENALLAAASRENVEQNAGQISNLSESVESLKGDLENLNAVVDERLTDIEGRVEALNADLDVPDDDSRVRDLEEALAALQSTAANQTDLDDLNEAINTLAEGLGLLVDEDVKAWQGTLGVEVGFTGRESVAALRGVVAGPAGSVSGYVGTDLIDLNLQGDVAGGFGVAGYYLSGPQGTAAFAGPSFRVSPALSAGVIAGSQNGLALGGYVQHLANQSDSVLPNLDVFVGATLNEDVTGSLSNLSAQGSAQYAVPLGAFFIAPKVSYQRSTFSDAPFQAIVPELIAGYLAQGYSVTGAFRYGLVSDLLGGPGRNIPEADLAFTTPGGVYSRLTLDANLPSRYGLGNFAEANPLLIDDLFIGFSVGYETRLAW